MQNEMYSSLMQLYLKDNSLVKQFIDSYNKFLEDGMQKVIDSQPIIEPQIQGMQLKLGKIRVEKPMITEADGSRRPLYPMEARMRDLSYTAPVFLEVTPVIKGVEKRTEDVFVGEIPVMLKSKICYLHGKITDELVKAGEDPMDLGGYFIINGTEKALMTLEDLAPNRILVSKDKAKDAVEAKVFSTRMGFRGRCTVERTSEGKITVSMPSYSKTLELVLVLKALGFDKPDKIMEAFASDSEVKNDVLLNLELVEAKNKSDALEVIGRRAAPGQPVEYQVRRAELLLDHYLFPHIGVDPSTRIAKAFYLCRMAERAINVAYGKRTSESKDHYANKRLKITGKLMEELFKYAFQFLVKDISYQIERANVRGRKLSMFVVVRPDALTDRVKYAFATGNWVGGHTGVCQPIDKYNFISSVSFLRRVTSPLAKKHPHHKARDLHGTHYGRLDPNETPEGPNCVAPDTMIILDNNASQTISDYEGNWHEVGLQTCNWESEKKVQNTKIARYVKQVTSNAFKITTKTGRTITATRDHPFYSQSNGKIPLVQLKSSEKVAVLPVIPFEFQKPTSEVVLDERDIVKHCPDKTDVEYILSTLKGKGLLPLKADNPKLQILARLVGHLFGDGTLSYSMRRHKSVVTIAFTGSENDLSEIASDVLSLGFKASDYSISYAQSVLSDRTISGYTGRRSCYSKPLFVLLAALGAPIGDKALKGCAIPKWIFEQPLFIKREFLGSYFGSEMTAPCVDKRTGKTFLQPSFSLNKSMQALESGILFTKQIEQLLVEFGVKLSRTVIVRGVVRKSGVETKKIKVMLSASMQNLLNLYGKIGFEYCEKRNALAKFAVGYLLENQYGASKREQLVVQVVQLAARGFTVSQIASKISCRRHDVANWLKTAARGKSVSPRVSEIDFPPFSSWIAQHAISNTGLVWEEIEKIEEVNCTDVRDVTTFSDNHNFFANGFLSGNCGLVKNLAIFCEVTIGTGEKQVDDALKQLGVSPKLDKVSVYINGRFTGFCENGEKLAKELRDRRRGGALDPQVNVAFYSNISEVFINTDEGRARRPLIVVKGNKPLLTSEHIEKINANELTWSALVKQGAIEYLDAEEEENTLVALYLEQLKNEERQYTHLETDPSAILGFASSQVPFTEYNMAPRVLMASQHTKQSLGLYASNFNIRSETRGYLLYYPQRPLVQTEVYNALGLHKRASGQNFVVAVLSYAGHNMNDAIVVNKAAVDRGLGRSVFIRTYSAEERRYPGGQKDTFEVPQEYAQGFLGPDAYSKLDSNGFISPEEPVAPNAVLIGKTSPPRFLKEISALDVETEKRRESSLAVRSNEDGIVDSLMISETLSGNRVVKVKVRKTNIPEIGDKFASRFGQKGVIALLADPSDLPFTKDGVVPDLIINPHAIPGRMTAGHLLEMLGAKAACLDGKLKDGTSFRGEKQSDFEQSLLERGFHPAGHETLYDGVTGRMMHAKVFIGVIYYQRLHHLVSLKMHARSRGPVQMLTHQPTEGRAREGGLRLGEMERDCFIGYGAASLLKERMIDSSDKTVELACGDCGSLAVHDKVKNKRYCPVCDSGDIHEVEMSYAFKLLLDEMKSIGIFPKLKLKLQA